jgi:hypothetical protein
MDKSDELRHLYNAPDSTEATRGLCLIVFNVQCQNNSAQILLSAREILQQLINHPPNEINSQLSLPDWFTSAFEPEKSIEEAEQWSKWWKSLSQKEQEIAFKEVKWSLENWLYWMQSDMRQWFWWDGVIINESTIKVVVEVEDYPFAWGALEWLFKAVDATTVTEEE